MITPWMRTLVNRHIGQGVLPPLQAEFGIFLSQTLLYLSKARYRFLTVCEVCLFQTARSKSTFSSWASELSLSRILVWLGMNISIVDHKYTRGEKRERQNGRIMKVQKRGAKYGVNRYQQSIHILVEVFQ